MSGHQSGSKRSKRAVARLGWAWVAWMGLVYGCGSTTATPTSASGAQCGQPTFDAAIVPSRSDGGGCMILASNYDQSCRVDSDCDLVAQGDYCTQTCLCRGAPINAGAVPKFYADVARVSSAADAAMAPCMCIVPSGPCCLGGMCQVGARCVDSGSCP